MTETANSGTAHLYFVPKLTDGTLLKVLEDIRTTQLSAAPSSVISGSLLEDEKSSLAQLRQSFPDVACDLLWLHLDAVSILMRRQIESVLNDHAQEGWLRWLRWRQDIFLILVYSEEGEDQVMTRWLMNGDFGNSQLLLAGPLRAEEMEDAVVRLQRLDGLRYLQQMCVSFMRTRILPAPRWSILIYSPYLSDCCWLPCVMRKRRQPSRSGNCT